MHRRTVEKERVMKHLSPVSKMPPAVAVSSLEIKLTASIQIIDRLLLAMQQRAWKTAPGGGGTIPTDTTPTV